MTDPQDLDDAAAYLCDAGQDLTTGPGWSAAVYAYNHSATYVQSVYLAASATIPDAAGQGSRKTKRQTK